MRGAGFSPPRYLPNSIFYELKNLVLKRKIVHNYKASWNSSKFIDIYNIVIELDIRWYILSVMNCMGFSHFWQFTHYSTTHGTAHATKCRNEIKNHFKRVLDHLPKLPFSRYFEWIYTASAYKNYVVIMIRADVNAGDFLKDILNKEDFWDMRLIYHKCWRLTTNTGELEFMAWDARLIFFYFDLS